MTQHKINESLFERFINFFIKKGFAIELEDSLIFPPSSQVVKAIQKYAHKSGEVLEFSSKSTPVTFYLDKVLYSTKIRMHRGGYFIHCREV